MMVIASSADSWTASSDCGFVFLFGRELQHLKVSFVLENFGYYLEKLKNILVIQIHMLSFINATYDFNLSHD